MATYPFSIAENAAAALENIEAGLTAFLAQHRADLLAIATVGAYAPDAELEVTALRQHVEEYLRDQYAEAFAACEEHFEFPPFSRASVRRAA